MKWTLFVFCVIVSFASYSTGADDKADKHTKYSTLGASVLFAVVALATALLLK